MSLKGGGGGDRAGKREAALIIVYFGADSESTGRDDGVRVLFVFLFVRARITAIISVV